jgi:hypothetical protein
VVIEELFGVRAGGRHALDEDAVQTPIFAALTRGGWRRRQQESASGSVASVASVEDFRRDPLTAPLPIQPAAAAATEWQAASVTGGVIVDMAAGEGRRRGSAVHRARAARERSAAPRDWTAAPREWAAASRDWAGLDALADTGRHHLRVAANW